MSQLVFDCAFNSKHKQPVICSFHVCSRYFTTVLLIRQRCKSNNNNTAEHSQDMYSQKALMQDYATARFGEKCISSEICVNKNRGCIYLCQQQWDFNLACSWLHVQCCFHRCFNYNSQKILRLQLHFVADREPANNCYKYIHFYQ